MICFDARGPRCPFPTSVSSVLRWCWQFPGQGCRRSPRLLLANLSSQRATFSTCTDEGDMNEEYSPSGGKKCTTPHSSGWNAPLQRRRWHTSPPASFATQRQKIVILHNIVGCLPSFVCYSPRVPAHHLFFRCCREQLLCLCPCNNETVLSSHDARRGVRRRRAERGGGRRQDDHPPQDGRPSRGSRHQPLLSGRRVPHRRVFLRCLRRTEQNKPRRIHRGPRDVCGNGPGAVV